jgi:AAA domain
MRACWREGIVPLLQMHDGLECSVTAPEQGELVARLACDAVKLEVPMRADLKFGRSWGDAKHTWDELHDRPAAETTTQIEPPQLQVGFSEVTKVPSGTDERTNDLPIGSESEHNLADAENGANGDEHVDNDESPPWSPTPEPVHVASIPFMITRMMKEQLHAQGFSEQQIFEMTPQQAHEHLGIEPVRAAPIEEAPSPVEEDLPSGGNGGTTWPDGDYGAGEQMTRAASAYTNTKKQNGAKLEATFTFRDAAGRDHQRELKWRNPDGTKTCSQRYFKNGQWVWKKPTDWVEVPYRLPELLTAPPSEPVYITEGPKDTETLRALNFVATTNPGGAGKWRPELTQWFKGKEIVYLLEDNDDSGRKHTAMVTAALRGVVPIIVTISFPELPETQDVSDWIELGGNRALLIARAEIERKRQTTQDIHIINLATVQSRAVDWLWLGHLARGGLELLAGTPEIGKSQIHCQYIAHLTTGRDWPNGMPGVPPCRVIMITAEDTAADTIVPRLKAAGANLTLVEQLHAIRRNGRDEMFLLGEDLERLARIVRYFGDVGLISLDPITAYMGSNKHFDSHRATDVRSQLMPLKRFAEEFGIAITAITHPPKNASAQALDHFIGSQAFIASARIGHLCLPEMVEDADGKKIPTGRRLFTNPKINIAARQPTLAYSIDVVDVEPDAKTGVMIRAPVICWEGEVAITAEEALAASRPSRSSARKTTDVDGFLYDILTGGPVTTSVIKTRGAVHGFSEDQLRGARQRLNVVAFREKTFPSSNKWALPQHAPDPEERKDISDGEQD